MLCFQPLGVGRGVLETGGGVTEKENNGIWDMQNKATLSQIQAPTLNIGGGGRTGKTMGCTPQERAPGVGRLSPAQLDWLSPGMGR